MKSAIALSMHKAGSTIADFILVEFFKEKGYQIDLISDQVMGSPLPESQIYFNYEPSIRLENVYYGIARDPDSHDMKVIPSLRTILQLRDPRDCITSLYFSATKSHRPPTDPDKLQEFLERREKFAAVDIDQFALDVAPGYLMRCLKLEEIGRTHSDCVILKYEEMVQNTEQWLARISTFLDQPITPELRAALRPYTDFWVGEEDSFRHKRQVTPGDHLRKLKPETVAQITEVLEPVLVTFGYDL